MVRIVAPIIPPKNPDECPPWLYRELRRIGFALTQSQQGLAAVTRNEAPDGSGTPLSPDLSGYFKLGGRLGGQLGRGATEAAGLLLFSSTANATKGFIHLGNPTPGVSIDEAQTLVGINKSAPESTLHIVGSLAGSSGSIVPSSDLDALDTQWVRRGGAGWTGGVGASVAANMSADDGVTTMGTINPSSSGNNPFRGTLSGTIIPGATYTITIRCATLGAIPVAGEGSFIGCSLVDSAGNRWGSNADGSETYNETNSPMTGILTPSPDFYTITRTVRCFGTPVATGDTANSFRISAAASANHLAADLYFGVTLLSIAQAGSSLLRWDLAGGTRSGQIDIFGHMGVNTGATAPGAILDVLQGANAGVPAFRIKAEATPTIGVYQFAITNNAGAALAFYDSAAGDYFVAPNMFASASFAVSSDGTFGTNFTQITSTAAGIVIFNLPNVGSGGDFVLTLGVQTLQTKTLQTTCVLVSSTASSGVAFQDTTTSSKKLRMVLSGAVGNNNFVIATTAARTYTFRDLSGGVVLDSGSALTSGRVPFATTGGALLDDAAFLFTAGSGLTLSAINLITDTTTGMKIATSTSQKLGFWNAAPIVQPTTAVAAATRTGGGGTTLTDTDTFDGYTVAQVVKALRNTGLLA